MLCLQVSIPPAEAKTISNKKNKLICSRRMNTSSWTGKTKPHLAHAVVCELDVSFRVQEHVVQFQIPVDDSSLVEVVECQTDLCRVEPDKKKKQRSRFMIAQDHVASVGKGKDESVCTWRVPPGASFVSACGTSGHRRLHTR